MDLVQEEAVADIIDASSQQSARSALRSLSGEFSDQVNALTQALIELRVFESILPYKKARLENSPGSAATAHNDIEASNNKRITTIPPCPCNSKTSSPVNECGAGKNNATPLSISHPSW
jgi:tRNA U34 5-carboxymethylaminomethyl modifying GTPase MnmE/TrmE